jgi:hypothetical protein
MENKEAELRIKKGNPTLHIAIDHCHSTNYMADRLHPFHRPIVRDDLKKAEAEFNKQEVIMNTSHTTPRAWPC